MIRQRCLRSRMVWYGLTAWLLAGTPAPAAEDVSHRLWDQLLQAHVREGRVDYPAVRAQRAQLDEYLHLLEATDPSALPSKAAQLAFWINAYNACVFRGVLEHAPVQSVRDIKGFFNQSKYPVGRAFLTLDQIEAQGRALGDWRSHFAVVCASSSCPTLRSEAYVADRLNEQLTEQTAQFLRDPARGWRLDEGALWVTQIFKWYAKDFVPKGKLSAETLTPVVAAYLDPATVDAVAQRPLKFLEYDWTLNAQPAP